MTVRYDPEQITYIGETTSRGECIRFGIKNKDRERHVYVIGKTGTGKSTLLESMAVQDFNNGQGIIFMDPHGSSVENLLNFVPKERTGDTIYLSPNDMKRPIAFNIMEDVGYDKRHLVAGNLLSSFKKIWGAETWSDRMSHILNNTILALLEYPDTTLLDINRMYANKAFRKRVVDAIKDPQVRSYWVDDFARYPERLVQEATPSIQNKIGQFTSNPVMRNIIGQKKSSIDFRDILDQQKIFLINLSKGQIGSENTALLGILLSTKIYISALSRADLNRADLDNSAPCNFFVDEFQSFASETFAEVLSEARKYKLNLVLAHQYVTQMSEVVRDAVIGNVGTTISFRIGPVDAELLETVFTPVFKIEDLINLQARHMYISMTIDGMTSRAFSAKSIEAYTVPDKTYRDVVIEKSREKYGSERSEVEKVIREALESDWKSSSRSIKPERANNTDKSFNKGKNKGNQNRDNRGDNKKKQHVQEMGNQNHDNRGDNKKEQHVQEIGNQNHDNRGDNKKEQHTEEKGNSNPDNRDSNKKEQHVEEKRKDTNQNFNQKPKEDLKSILQKIKDSDIVVDSNDDDSESQGWVPLNELKKDIVEKNEEENTELSK